MRMPSDSWESPPFGEEPIVSDTSFRASTARERTVRWCFYEGLGIDVTGVGAVARAQWGGVLGVPFGPAEPLALLTEPRP
jgi:hypothetical protein